MPRPFYVLLVGTFINRLGGFVVPFLAIYLTTVRHFSIEFAGFVASAIGAGTLIAGPLGGYLSDRIGRRITLTCSLCLGAVAVLSLLLVRAQSLFVLAAFLLGLVGDMYRPAVSAAIVDIVPRSDLQRAFGLMYWVVNLAFSVAAATAGMLAKRGFEYLFIIDAATTLTYAAVAWKYLPETRPSRRSHERISFQAPFRNLSFLGFVLVSVLFGLVYFQANITLPVDMQNQGLTPRDYGFLMGLNGLIVLLIQPLVVGPLSQRSPYRVLALAGVLTAIGFGLHAAASTAGVYAIAVILWTLGEIACVGANPTVVAHLAPRSLRGSYQGVFQMSWGVGNFLAPLTGAFIVARFGRVALWLGCLALGLIAAVGHLTLTKRITKNININKINNVTGD